MYVNNVNIAYNKLLLFEYIINKKLMQLLVSVVYTKLLKTINLYINT